MAVSSVFRRHGQLCASHQWEVIVSIVTFTVCMLTVSERQALGPRHWPDRAPCRIPQEYFGADAVVMTAVRCIALLYTYHQFRKLRALGSKYILGLAGLFTVISTAVFTSSIINFMHSDMTDLKDALFFFLLLIDLSKVTRLAQYALASRRPDQLEANIARGMQVLGPQITLDVLVEVLLISVGTLSGVYRLEVLCCYACMSAVISYLMFMTFYPACLSLVLEMSSEPGVDSQPWQLRSLTNLLQEDELKPNVVIQRVKIIMSIGLTFVHFVSRWPSVSPVGGQSVFGAATDAGSCDAPIPSPYNVLLRWMSVSAEHLVVLIIVVALVVKYVLFEAPDAEEARLTVQAEDRAMLRALRPQLRRRCTSVLITEDSDGEVKVDEVPPPAASADASCQTPAPGTPDTGEGQDGETEEPAPRELEECARVMEEDGPERLSDSELLVLLRARRLRAYQLEARLGDAQRAVAVRRRHVAEAGRLGAALDGLPHRDFEYERVLGACCENVLGYVPLPLGVVGPLTLDGRQYHVPLATTEGALVASTNRGCLAVRQGGVNSYIVGDGMTRAPVIECQSAKQASEVLFWLETTEGFHAVKAAFDSTSRFARLTRVEVNMFGRQLFVRFVAQTGDAMGMNMVSKGTEKALEHLQQTFPGITVTSVSSNVCTDKKPSAVNWTRGRGKSVVCEAVVPAAVVSGVLKTSVPALVNLAVKKNLIGSAVAGSIGGNNAHAANIVTAIYIATGQDPAQNVCSSNCMTLLEPWGERGEDLYITCTMPCVEVGTVGGGTVLKAQRACLQMLGCQGASAESAGQNARRLASIVCATVLAGELSLLAAQSAGHLVQSHMTLNRNPTPRSSRQEALHR